MKTPVPLTHMSTYFSLDITSVFFHKKTLFSPFANKNCLLLTLLTTISCEPWYTLTRIAFTRHKWRLDFLMYFIMRNFHSAISSTLKDVSNYHDYLATENVELYKRHIPYDCAFEQNVYVLKEFENHWSWLNMLAIS